MELVNLVAYFIIMLCTTWGIISPSFRDGLVLKIGMIFTFFGSIASTAHLIDGELHPDQSQTLMAVGFAIGVAAITCRRLLRPVWVHVHANRPHAPRKVANDNRQRSM